MDLATRDIGPASATPSIKDNHTVLPIFTALGHSPALASRVTPLIRLLYAASGGFVVRDKKNGRDAMTIIELRNLIIDCVMVS